MTHDFRTLAGIMAAAEELNTTARNVGLEYWFDLDFHFMSISTRITKGIGPGCLDMWAGCTMAKLSAGMIGQKMEEAAEFLAKYQEDQAANLEKEVADLAEQLKTKRAALRKAKKEGAK